MGKTFKYLSAIAILFTTIFAVKAQNTRSDKLYTVSGIGTSIPMSESSDFLGPRISTTLGLNLGLGNGGLFIYPKVSLHAFEYNGIRPDDNFNYTAQNARATTYLLNLAIGYRKMINKFAIYGFVGGGGGIILTPMVNVNAVFSTVKFSNRSNTMTMLEAGAGTEYSLGGLLIFAEVSYMNGFNKIQDRSFTTMPVTVGIKPNLSKLFHKK